MFPFDRKSEAITIGVLVKATMATLAVCYPSVCDNLKVNQVNGRKLVIVSGAEQSTPVICVTRRFCCNKKFAVFPLRKVYEQLIKS